MNETLVAAGLVATFLAGVAAGHYLRGWLTLTQDAIRKALRDEQRGRRGCEGRERKLIEDLRRLTAEARELEERNVLITEILSGNLPPELMKSG